MEYKNKENIKKLVSALSSINADIDRKKGGCFMTPLQVRHTEELLSKIYGIKVDITDIGWFKRAEEYYRKVLEEMG